MSGQFSIQRVPRGLQPLLNLFGPATPGELRDEVQGTIELLQFYGLSMRQYLATAASVATGTSVQVAGTPAANENWFVLFALSANFVINAADTAVSLFNNINRGGLGITYEAVGPLVFAAGATNRLVTPRAQLPYPLLCPPGTLLSAIGEWNGAGNRTVTVTAEIGVL